MIKLEFIPNSASSDATTAYNVRFDHPYTVGEFIKEFYEDSKLGNWGSVEIGKSSDDWFGKKLCCYHSGKWEVECPKEYLDRVIKSAHGRGGWSMYDFVLVLEEATPVEVAYICDKKACGEKCPNQSCYRTCNIEHAKNFKRTSTGNYIEIDPSDRVDDFCDRSRNHKVPVLGGYKSVGEIVETMTVDQKQCLYWLVGAAMVDYWDTKE